MTRLTTSFLPALRVVREVSNLLSVLKSPILSVTTLQSCDTQFSHCFAAFPAHHQTRRTEYIDPCSMLPLIYLQNARLILHRHNLTILSAPEVRADALDQCGLIAWETTQLLSRCMMDPPTSPSQHSSTSFDWATRLISAASAFLCTHIWRCTLVLCLRGDFEAALICARVSATIADARPINTACGKYLAFFLDRLMQKVHLESRAYVENDEEMIVYVSADLQGNVEHSWIWQGGEGTWNQPLLSPKGLKETTEDEGPEPDLSADSTFGRAGWEPILEALNQLAQKKQHDLRQRHAGGLLLPLQGEATHRASSHSTGSSQGTPVGSNRISIANII